MKFHLLYPIISASQYHIVNAATDKEIDCYKNTDFQYKAMFTKYADWEVIEIKSYWWQSDSLEIKLRRE